MGPATSLHTDESDAQVRSEPQQLRARQPSAYHYLASPVQANKIKNLLPRSMPIVSSSMDRLLSHLLYPVGGRGGGPYQLVGSRFFKRARARSCAPLQPQEISPATRDARAMRGR